LETILPKGSQELAISLEVLNSVNWRSLKGINTSKISAEVGLMVSTSKWLFLFISEISQERNVL